MQNLLAAVFALAVGGPAIAPIDVRGRTLDLALDGQRGHPPVLLASGGGEGARLGPRTAVLLAEHGYFVVSVDAKQYLSAFTEGGGTLSPADVASDFAVLIDFAARGATAKPVLVGVSEGAGLGLLAAVDPVVKEALCGAVGVGLRDDIELTGRVPDWILGVVPEEAKTPGLSATAIVKRLAPLAFAQVHLPSAEIDALTDARRIQDRAEPPKRMWVIGTGHDRLSDDGGMLARGLLEAVDWVARAPR